MLNPAESSEVNIQDDIEFAFNPAESGDAEQESIWRSSGSRKATTGNVSNAVTGITEAKPKLFFNTLWCKDCEQARETPEQSKRTMALRRDSSLRFLDDPGF